MADKSKLKLIIRGTRNQIRSRLYRGEDHLLLVEGHISEEYRRFFYQDIQAALWMVDRGSAWLIGILLSLLLLVGGLLILGGEEWMVFLAMFFLIPGALILLRFLYVMFTGGYCRFYLTTAAQQTLLPGVNTHRKCMKILNVLDEQIPEEIPETPMAGDVSDEPS